MKIRHGMVLIALADEFVAVCDDADDFRGVVRMNKTAAAIWNGIEAGKTEEQIAASLVERFDGVDSETASACTRSILEELKNGGIIE